MSEMTDLSKGNRVFHPDMKRVRYYGQDEIYPPIFQHYHHHHLPCDVPRGGSYSVAPYHHMRPYHVPLNSSDETKVWVPESRHNRGSLTPVQMRDDIASSLSGIDPKPHDTNAQQASDNPSETTQDATHLILTAASALTSFSKPSSFSASSNRDNVSPSMEKGQIHYVSKELVKKKSGREKAIKFPVKLMNILSCDEYQEIVCWMPDGKAFMVKKPKAFVSNILPLHFKEVKFSSFTRKLHRWGFTKMLRGKECGAYCHNDFQRDRMDLCSQMRCCDRDGMKTLPSDDMSLSSSDVHQPQSSDRILNQKEYPCQQARTGSGDYSYHEKQDMRQYSHPMPMPQLPETYLGAYSTTTYRPSSGGMSNYYDWNTWSSISNNNSGPSWDYERMMRNPWQYPARDKPMHKSTHRKIHSQNTYPSANNL